MKEPQLYFSEEYVAVVSDQFQLSLDAACNFLANAIHKLNCK